MKFTHLLDAVLDALHDGRIFRKVFSIALIVGAVAAAIGVALSIFGVLGVGLSSFVPAEMKLGALLIAVCLAAMGVGIVNVMLYHSRGLSVQEPSPFSLAQIGSSMIRMLGELYAVVMCGVGVGALLGSLFGAGQLIGSSGLGVVPGLPMGAVAGGGGAAFAAFVCAMLAFLGLAGAYWLAEASGAIFDIAVNVRKLVRAPGPGVEPLIVAAPQERQPMAPPRCPACGAPNVERQPFCTDCGTRLL